MGSPMLKASLTSGRFCVAGSSFSMPWLSQPTFLPAWFDAMLTSSLICVGEEKNSLDSVKIVLISAVERPVVDGSFAMKTKP